MATLSYYQQELEPYVSRKDKGKTLRPLDMAKIKGIIQQMRSSGYRTESVQYMQYLEYGPYNKAAQGERTREINTNIINLRQQQKTQDLSKITQVSSNSKTYTGKVQSINNKDVFVGIRSPPKASNKESIINMNRQNLMPASTSKSNFIDQYRIRQALPVSTLLIPKNAEISLSMPETERQKVTVNEGYYQPIGGLGVARQKYGQLNEFLKTKITSKIVDVRPKYADVDYIKEYRENKANYENLTFGKKAMTNYIGAFEKVGALGLQEFSWGVNRGAEMELKEKPVKLLILGAAGAVSGGFVSGIGKVATGTFGTAVGSGLATAGLYAYGKQIETQIKAAPTLEAKGEIFGRESIDMGAMALGGYLQKTVSAKLTQGYYTDSLKKYRNLPVERATSDIAIRETGLATELKVKPLEGYMAGSEYKAYGSTETVVSKGRPIFGKEFYIDSSQLPKNQLYKVSIQDLGFGGTTDLGTPISSTKSIIPSNIKVMAGTRTKYATTAQIDDLLNFQNYQGVFKSTSPATSQGVINKASIARFESFGVTVSPKDYLKIGNENLFISYTPQGIGFTPKLGYVPKLSYSGTSGTTITQPLIFTGGVKVTPPSFKINTVIGPAAGKSIFTGGGMAMMQMQQQESKTININLQQLSPASQKSSFLSSQGTQTKYINLNAMEKQSSSLLGKKSFFNSQTKYFASQPTTSYMDLSLNTPSVRTKAKRPAMVINAAMPKSAQIISGKTKPVNIETVLPKTTPIFKPNQRYKPRQSITPIISPIITMPSIRPQINRPIPGKPSNPNNSGNPGKFNLKLRSLHFGLPKSKPGRIKSKSQYMPSLEAITFNIKGKSPNKITPFSLRPITNMSFKMPKISLRL